MLNYLNPELFTQIPQLRFLSLRSCSLNMIEPRIAGLLVNLQFLDVRDNSLTCNCSVQWIRNHLLSQKNHSSSSSSSSTKQSFGTTVLAAVKASLPNYQESGASEREKSRSSHKPLTASHSAGTTTITFREEQPSSSASFSSQSQTQWQAKTMSEKEVGEEVDEETLNAAASSPASPGGTSLSLFPMELAASLLPHHPVASNAVQLSAVELFLQELEQQTRCLDPVKDKRLIDLGIEMIACSKSESMTPIVMLALVVGVAMGVIIIAVVRFREQIVNCLLLRRGKGANKRKKKNKKPYEVTRSFLPSSPVPVSANNKYNPTPVSTLHVNNNRKVYHTSIHPFTQTNSTSTGGSNNMSSQRHHTLIRTPFDEFGSLSSKPEFIYVHNTINSRGNNNSSSRSSSRSINDVRNGIISGIGVNSSRNSGNAVLDPRTDCLDSIYRSRHVINNLLNSPYEVVPILPPAPFPVYPSSHRNWNTSSQHPHRMQHQHPDQVSYPPPPHLMPQHFTDPAVDPDDPFNFYERLYEDPDPLPDISHLTPSTEL